MFSTMCSVSAEMVNHSTCIIHTLGNIFPGFGELEG